MRRLTRAFATALLVGILASSAEAALRDEAERALRAATVLVGSGCSGALAEGPDLVLTAAHCVAGSASVALRFSSGATRTGWVAEVDRVADQALLVLEQPVAIAPLFLARRLPIAGTVLYFQGNPQEPRFQEAKLVRVGRCPSLPHLSNALFTTVQGRPGDSGAPIVDAAARIVGLVHGGAQCEIATPADTLVRLIDRFLDAPLQQDELVRKAGDGRAPGPGRNGLRLSAPRRACGRGARDGERGVGGAGRRPRAAAGPSLGLRLRARARW